MCIYIYVYIYIYMHNIYIYILYIRLIPSYNCRSRFQEAAPSLRGRNTPGIEGIPDLTAEQLTCSGSGAMPQAPVAEQQKSAEFTNQKKRKPEDWMIGSLKITQPKRFQEVN